MTKKTLLSWSSGKDSAWSLHLLRQDTKLEVAGLMTTLNEAFDRVAMHAVRRSLLEAQAKAAGLPLHVVPIPWPCSNQEYERIMAEVCWQDENSIRNFWLTYLLMLILAERTASSTPSSMADRCFAISSK